MNIFNDVCNGEIDALDKSGAISIGVLLVLGTRVCVCVRERDRERERERD